MNGQGIIGINKTKCCTFSDGCGNILIIKKLLFVWYKWINTLKSNPVFGTMSDATLVANKTKVEMDIRS